MLPITIVSATRFNQQEFYSQSALGKSFSQTYCGFPVKLKIYFNNSKPLPACYNDAVASVPEPEEILVFIHDDVFIIDFYWVDKLMWGLQRFDIMGVAGTKRRLPRQASWRFIDATCSTLEHASNISGIVGHGRQFPCQLSVYGQPGQDCKLLDGVLLSTKKSTLQNSQIVFDERFDFHFYDLDLCRQAEARNLRMGTIPLGIIHESAGQFGSPQWKKNYEAYLLKWKE